MSGTALLTEIISILIAGIQGLASGIGSGINALVSDLFIDSTTNGLSTFGIVVCVFAGIGLAVGLSRLIVRWISSLGGSRV